MKYIIEAKDYNFKESNLNIDKNYNNKNKLIIHLIFIHRLIILEKLMLEISLFISSMN